MSKKHTLWFDSRKEKLFLGLTTVVAFLLRFYLIPQNLFFGPEQGIDFLTIRSIVYGHKLTLIGAKTDISGIFHGPLYYYIASLPFALSHGNPIVVSAFLIFLSSLTVIPLYILGKSMFSQRVGILSVLLFIFSFEAIASSRWLSGQPLAIPLTVLFVLFFYKYLQGKTKYILLVAVCFGLIAQLEFLNLILFSIFILVILCIHYKQVFKTHILTLLGSLVIAISLSLGTFILFDLRHQFLIFHSILAAFSGKGGFHVSYSQSFQSILQIYDLVFVRTLFPLVSTTWDLLVVLFIATIIWQLKGAKEKSSLLLLSLFIFLPSLILFTLHQSVLEHFLMPTIPFLLLMTAFLISLLMKKNAYLGYLVLGAFLFCNLFAWIVFIPNNENVFFQSTQPFLHYSDQVKTIETIYKDANHNQFAFQAYTIPLWSQEGWQYLFWYFGSTKYGQYPSQVTKNKLYVIVQRDPGKFQNFWLTHVVKDWGSQENKFRFGAIDLEVLKVSTKK